MREGQQHVQRQTSDAGGDVETLRTDTKGTPCSLNISTSLAKSAEAFFRGVHFGGWAIRLLPGRIRIERGHSLGHIVCQAEGPLEDLAEVIDNEVITPSFGIIGIGDERVSAEHLAVDDVVDRAAGRVRPLPGQDL